MCACVRVCGRVFVCVCLGDDNTRITVVASCVPCRVSTRVFRGEMEMGSDSSCLGHGIQSIHEIGT